MIGCTCAVCTSSDPHDQRTRPSVYVTLPDGTRILIDTSPDLRAQALRHAPDACGRGALHARPRRSCPRSRRHAAVQRHSGQPHPVLRRCADDRRDPQNIFVRLRSEDACRRAACPRSISTWSMRPSRSAAAASSPCRCGTESGSCTATGSDRSHTSPTSAGSPTSRGRSSTASTCSCSTRCATVRIPRTSASSEALEATARIKPADAWFTHICHDLGHAATNASLPPHVQLAYDGLSVDFSVD